MRTTPSLPLPRLPKIGHALPQYETQVSGVAGVDTSAALTQSGYAASRKRLQLAAWNPDAGVGRILGAEPRACAADTRRRTRSSAGPASAPLRSLRSVLDPRSGHQGRISGGGAIRRRGGGGGGGRGAPPELPGGPRAVLSQRTPPPRSEVRARNFRFAVFGAVSRLRDFSEGVPSENPRELPPGRRRAGEGQSPSRRAGAARGRRALAATPQRAASQMSGDSVWGGVSTGFNDKSLSVFSRAM